MDKQLPVKSAHRPIRKTMGGLCLPKKTNFDLNLLLEAAKIIEAKEKITICYSNNCRYIGEHINNIPNGYGEVIFQDGKRYIGEFKDGKLHGKITKYSSTNEILFSGLCNEGKRNGEVTIFFTKKRRFECNYINDVLNGNAKFFVNDIFKIELNFTNGKVDKVIEYHSNTSVKYNIINEKIDGDIKIHLPDGTIVKGTKKNCWPISLILELNNL